MGLSFHHRRSFLRAALVSGVTLMSSAQLYAQSATRDLSGFGGAGVLFSVTITLDTPTGTSAVGVEEAPPSGWVVSNISPGGSWDAVTMEVKWGPFLAGSIPPSVTYDVMPPVDALGQACFSGTASFDGPAIDIVGDLCVGQDIPALSGVGMFVLASVVLTAAMLILRRRRIASD